MIEVELCHWYSLQCRRSYDLCRTPTPQTRGKRDCVTRSEECLREPSYQGPSLKGVGRRETTETRLYLPARQWGGGNRIQRSSFILTVNAMSYQRPVLSRLPPARSAIE